MKRVLTRCAVLVGLLATSAASGGDGDGCVQGERAPVDDCAEWTLRTTEGPAPRTGHAVVYDAARGVTLLFGGHDGSAPRADTWEWDGADWVQRFPASSPSPRTQHAMVYDGARDVTVLFGGDAVDELRYNPETWEWDGEDWELRDTGGPSGRRFHAMAYDDARGVTVLFGGGEAGGDEFLGDTWEWNGDSWDLRSTEGPSPRIAAAMAYDAAREVTVLFGGAYNDGTAWIAYGDTWEWDGTEWTLRALDGPSPRWRHPLAFVPTRGLSVLFGGNCGVGSEVCGDTWGWNGTVWSLLSEVGPDARLDAKLAYDGARGVAVLFGGAAGWPFYGDTWELTLTGPEILQSPTGQMVPISETAVFSVEAEGAGTLTFQWHKEGVPLSDDGRISGTTTDTLTIDDVCLLDTGTYYVFVANACDSVISAFATLVTNPYGDLNCDGVVNFFDIEPFVLAITAPSQYVTEYPDCDYMLADCNGDGWMDFFDIDAFVELVVGG